MYFTADKAGNDVGNAIGVAYSNDGTNWVIHDQEIISPDGGFDGSYGAGESGGGWGPEQGKIVQLYTDTTTGLADLRIRYKESTDSLSFSPTPSLDTVMSEEALEGGGRAPETGYFAPQDRWFAAMQSLNGDTIQARILRANAPQTVFSEWTELAGVNGAHAGEEMLILPSLARNENSSLYVDSSGYIYMFSTIGMDRPDVDTWKIAQSRLQLLTPINGNLSFDSFSLIGQNRKSGDPLNGTNTEVGGEIWQAAQELIFLNAGIASSASLANDRFAMIPIDTSTDHISTVEGNLDLSGSDWVAIGFSDVADFGLFGGQLWVLLHRLTEEITVFADGTTNILIQAPLLPEAMDRHKALLEYNHQTNFIRVVVDRAEVLNLDLGSLPYTPTINAAGFHVFKPIANEAFVESFQINRSAENFADGFESGDSSNWSSTVP